MKDIYSELRDTYFDRLGDLAIGYDSGRRNRKYVEMRAAFCNALKPFVKQEMLADTIGKDRTTTIHYWRNHEIYYKWSGMYRYYFGLALGVVSEQIGTYESVNKGRYDQIETLDRAIKKLEEIRAGIGSQSVPYDLHGAVQLAHQQKQ